MLVGDAPSFVKPQQLAEHTVLWGLDDEALSRVAM
jgi:hypothetical protein